MRKVCLGIIGLALFSVAFGQEKDKYRKSATLAINFGMMDFKTPQSIKTSSAGSVLGNGNWAKVSDMSPALGISFMKGISNYFDYCVSGYFSSVDYPFRDKTTPEGSSSPLGEFDASVRMKMLTDNFILVPYLKAGIGGSIYKGSKLDAFMPVGAGLQLKLSTQTFLVSDFEYRLPVTQRANYHFLYSIGIATGIGKK